MANIYNSGVVYSESHLWQRVTEAMLSAGWTLVSTITANSDAVYSSTGEDGYAINYLRVSAKKSDDYSENRSFTQRSDADGYTGYLNFFAYQHFPNAGGDGDGAGKIGTYGPILYSLEDSSVGKVIRVNLLKSAAGAISYVELPATMSLWKSSGAGTSSAGFDGFKKIYFNLTTNSYSYDVVSGVTSASLNDSGANATHMTGITYVPETGLYYILAPTSVGTSGSQVCLFSFNYENEISNFRFVANAPWNAGSDGAICVGYKNFFFVGRGQFGSNSDFGRYDVLTNTWVYYSLGNSIAIQQETRNMIFASRQQTGQAKHRLYLLGGNNSSSHRYVNVEDDGSITDANWTTVNDSPFNNGMSGYEWDGGDRIYYAPGPAGSSKRELYYFSISGDSWNLVDSLFFPEVLDDDVNLYYQNGLMSRARVIRGGADQKYWVFSNLDRVIVVTKDSFGYYNYCYAGAIQSFISAETKATLSSGVTAGTLVTIPVNSTSSFAIGDKVQIFGTSADVETQTALDGSTYDYIRTEHFEISSINPGVSITAAVLNGNYSTGAKIGFDLQNTVLSMDGMGMCQSLNKPNISADFAAGDPIDQTYLLTPAVSLDTSAKADVNERTDEFVLWPMVVSSDTNYPATAKEVRGQLNGIYVAGSGVGQSEDIISINGSSYIVFDIAKQEDSRFLVFGPVT